MILLDLYYNWICVRDITGFVLEIFLDLFLGYYWICVRDITLFVLGILLNLCSG